MKGKNENIKADSSVCSDLLRELDFPQAQNEGNFCAIWCLFALLALSYG